MSQWGRSNEVAVIVVVVVVVFFFFNKKHGEGICSRRTSCLFRCVLVALDVSAS